MAFRKSYIDWIETEGFYIRDVWDFEHNRVGLPGKLKLFPIEKRILQHVLSPNEYGEFPYKTILYSTTKKSGKTLLGASVAGWFQECAPVQSEIYTIANSLEQAEGRVMKDVKYHYRQKSELEDDTSWKISANVVENSKTGTFIRAMSGAFKSNAGTRHALTVWDELWGAVCTDPLTEILTRDGWKTYDQLQVGELVATWRDEYFEWKPVQNINVFDYDGDMYHLNHRRSDMFLTPNHKVLGKFRTRGAVKLNEQKWEFREAYRAADSYEGEVPNAANWDVPYRDFILPAIETNAFGCGKKYWNERVIPMGAWMEFLGYYLSEGCIVYTQKNGNPCAVVISQSKKVHPETCSRIEKCLDEIGFKWTRGKTYYRVSGAQLAYYIESAIPKGATNKYVPDEFKNVDRESLQRFIDSFMDGDGWNAGKGYQLELSSKKLLEDVVEIGIKAGYIARFMGERERKSPNSDYMSTVYRASLSKGAICYDRRRWTKEHYKGKVWCPTTENGTWLARRNGHVYWTGNSESDVRMWDEMTPIPTVPYSLRFIVTYAGFYNESKLLWDLYLQGVGKCEHSDGMGEPVPELADIVDSEGNPVCFHNGDLFVYWNHEPTMPWQTQKYYDSQLQSLRPMAYLRLHENRWVTTQETFIPISWWTDSHSLETSADYWPDHPYREMPIYIGVDAGVKRDCTAIAGVAHDRERGKIGLVFHKIWTPIAGETLDLDVTVEQYLLKKNQQYNIKILGYDPTFLYQTMIKLKARGLPLQEFIQVGNQMVEASQTLFDLLQNRRLETYFDEQAKQHIQNAVAKQDGRGVRITKIKYSRGAAFFKPVDFVIALAIACHLAVGDGQMNNYDPIVLNSPFSDMTGWFQDMNPQNKWLPFALRD